MNADGGREFDVLKERLSAYDSGDLVAGCGALQLLPENAFNLTRLEVAASVVAALSTVEGPTMSARKWRDWTNGAPLSHFAHLEDPFDDLFTNQVAFVGGAYTVFSGLASEAIRVQECLAEAVFDEGLGLGDSSFREWCQELFVATLRISNSVAVRAGLSRAETVPDTISREISIPAGRDFESLKAAVTLDGAALGSILAGLDPGVLDPVTADLGEENLDFDDNEQRWQDTIHRRPLIRAQGDLIVASIGNLLPALRHATIVEASVRGVLDSLARAISGAEAIRVERALFLLRARPCDVNPPELPTSAVGQTWFRQVDEGLRLNVILLSDALGGYDENSMFGEHDPSPPDLEEYIAKGSRALHEAFPGEKVLHLVCLGGVGRSGAIFLSDCPAGDQLLLLSITDLGLMAFTKETDALALWKYARAADHIRQRTHVVCFRQLDEFALYRDHASSYYLSDDALPTTLTIVPGYSKTVTENVLDTVDAHWALYPDRRVIDVQLRRGDRRIPLYFAPSEMGRCQLLVEGFPQPVWVMAATDIAGPRRTVFGALVEMICYWLWQFKPALEPTLVFLANAGISVLALSLSLEDPEAWETGDAPDEAPTEVTISPGERPFLELRIPSGLIPLLDRGTNEGERSIMRDVLRGVAALALSLGMSSKDALVAEVLDRALDAHAPMGHKKALMLMSKPRMVAMRRSASMERVRTVQEADEAELLDARGEFLRESGRVVGDILRKDRVRVLNDCADFFFSQLKAMLADLDHESALERLVAMNEALLFELAMHETQFSTRVACYGDVIPETVDNWRAEQQGLVRASRASRFLIEYLVAQLSPGASRLRMGTYDRLLALAALILDDATHSDSIYYELVDSNLSILSSGRLGTDRKEFDAAQSAFLVDVTQAELTRRDKSLEDWWNHSESQGPQPDWLTDLNAATESEFGASIQAIAEFIHTVGAIGDDQAADAKTSRVDFLLAEVATRLSWEPDKCRLVFDLLALRPREDFFPTDDKQDAYPWRYNRNLSYVRRPLLVVESEDGEHVFWGNRHIDSAGSNLADLCHGGRLKATTLPMQDYLSKTRNRVAEAFNDQAAETLERPSAVVRKRIEKFGGLLMERAPGQKIGDIDVLEIDERQRTIRTIETKDFALARTPAEMHNELTHLLVGTAEIPSAAARTLERAAWVRTHLDSVLESFGIDASGRWTVTPLIVVDETLMTPYLRDAGVEVLSIDALKHELGSGSV